MPGNIQSCLNLVGPTRADQQVIYVKNNYKPWIDYNDPIVDPPSLDKHKKRLEEYKKRYSERHYK